jgi:hypothetical protein
MVPVMAEKLPTVLNLQTEPRTRHTGYQATITEFRCYSDDLLGVPGILNYNDITLPNMASITTFGHNFTREQPVPGMAFPSV